MQLSRTERKILAKNKKEIHIGFTIVGSYQYPDRIPYSQADKFMDGRLYMKSVRVDIPHLGLIKIDANLNLHPYYVSVMKLPEHDYNGSENCVIVGWGSFHDKFTFTHTLAFETKVKVLDAEECRTANPEFSALHDNCICILSTSDDEICEAAGGEPVICDVWGAIKPMSLELEGKVANTKEIQKLGRLTGFGVIIDKNLILSAKGDAPGKPQMDANILGVHVKGDVERVVGYGQTVFKDVPEKPYQVPLKAGTLYQNPKNHIALYETTEKLRLEKQKAESVILASKEYKIGDKCVIIQPRGTQNGQEISEFDVEILDKKNCMQMVPDIDSDLLCFNMSSCAVEASGVPVICSGELASIITVEKADCEKPLVGADIFKNRKWIHSKANELYIRSSSSNVVSNPVTFATVLLILYGKLFLI
uniref:Peptidase S1 domain-containing protein n=1 Tax=Glossina austeni TaxID=7395 RepID=A0A1A9V1A4_GLOAU